MPEDTLIALILTIVLTVAVVAIIIAEVVWITKTHKKYLYSFRSHEIVFRVARNSVQLYVDGVLEDELGGLRVCMLHATVEGVEIKARYELRGFKVQIGLSAGGTPLQLMGMGK